MEDAVLLSRLQFAFTIVYHYLFPQLTMGLALLLVILKTLYLRRGDETYNLAVRFWGKIFAVTFIMGVVTGIPMEFQFGTNWAAFSRYARDIIAAALAMGGAFAFFLESAFLGIFLFGERRFGQKMHWFSTFMLFLGTWASGYFILASNAWMQNPVGYEEVAGGGLRLVDYWAVLLNPWVFVQFAHNQGGSVVTAAFVMTGLGAYYLLARRHEHYGRMFVRVGLVAGVIASGWMLFPTGHLSSDQVAHHQPVALAAMEGHFRTEREADLVFIGQPDMERLRIDNPIVLPGGLSILLYGPAGGEVKGLEDFPEKNWPDNIPLLYYSYHVMVSLGTFFIAIAFLAAFMLWRGALHTFRGLLSVLI